MTDSSPTDARVLQGCDVYVDAPVGRDALLSWLAGAVPGARAVGRTVESPALVVSVLRVEEADADAAAAPDGFVYYPYLLEAEPGDGATPGRFVSAVGALLERLWAAGWRAVAAGPFDAELPYGGGFDGRRLTFPGAA